MKTRPIRQYVIPEREAPIEPTTQAADNVDRFLGVLIRITVRLELDRAQSTGSLTDIEKRDRVSGAKVDPRSVAT